MSSTRRVVVILGAGGTLGTAISRTLAREPKTDLVLSDLSEQALRETVAALPAGPDAAEVVTAPADVSDFGQVEAVVKRAVDRFGRLDVLISNAGVLSPNGRIHNLDTGEWERAFRVNVLGPVHGIRAAVPVMRAQRSGSIILTASVAGMTAWSHSSPYCVTKAGVIQLAKVAAVEYARDHIRVNCVCPGTFLSAMHAGPAGRSDGRHRGQAPARPRAGRRPRRRLLLPGQRRRPVDDRLGHRGGRRLRRPLASGLAALDSSLAALAAATLPLSGRLRRPGQRLRRPLTDGPGPPGQTASPGSPARRAP